MTTNQTLTQDWESLTRAAARTGMSVKTLRRRVADGSLPAYRTGPRMIRVRSSDIDRLMRPIPSVGE